METEQIGFRIEVELKREFTEPGAAVDAWARLRVEAAKFEDVTPDKYDIHGIRKAHFDQAHEIYREGHGYKVRSKWFILEPPRHWPGGTQEIESAREHLLVSTKRMATALGFPEAELLAFLVPAKDWK